MSNFFVAFAQVISPKELLIGLFGLAILGLAAASLGVWGRIVYLLASGTIVVPKRFRSESAHVPIAAFFLVVMLVLYLMWSVITRGSLDDFNAERMSKVVRILLIEGAITTGILAATLLIFTRRKTDFYRMGFRCDHLLQQVSWGGFGFLAALIPVYTVIILVSLAGARDVESVHPLLRLLDERGLGPDFIYVFASAVIMAPIKEELMFRVVLQNGLAKYVGSTGAILITAFTFAAVHGFPDAIGLIPLALILGYVYHRRKSYLAVVLLHAVFNALNLVFALVGNYAKEIVEQNAMMSIAGGGYLVTL